MTQSTYELVKGDFTNNGIDHINLTDTDGQIWIIPIDKANADYQAYLNKDTLASELSNPSTPQAGE